MDYLNRYNKKIGNGQTNAAKNPFIERALNKIKVHKFTSGEVDHKELEAVLIFRDKEGPDNGILYTYEKDGLNVGDSIVKKSNKEDKHAYYMLTEEVKRVDGSQRIRVFNALEVNVVFNSRDNSEVSQGYLLSNLRNNIRESARGGVILELKTAVLVTSRKNNIRLGKVLNVRNLITGEESYASWMVDGIDDVSNPGVYYVHLKQVLKEEFPENEEEVDENEVKPLSNLTLSTHNGYIKTVPSAGILVRTADEVTITVPDIQGELIVTTKNSANELVEKVYQVRG